MGKLNEYIEARKPRNYQADAKTGKLPGPVLKPAKRMSHEMVLRSINDIALVVAHFADEAIRERTMMFAGRSDRDRDDIMERIVEEIQRAVAEQLL